MSPKTLHGFRWTLLVVTRRLGNSLPVPGRRTVLWKTATASCVAHLTSSFNTRQKDIGKIRALRVGVHKRKKKRRPWPQRCCCEQSQSSCVRNSYSSILPSALHSSKLTPEMPVERQTNVINLTSQGKRQNQQKAAEIRMLPCQRTPGT